MIPCLCPCIHSPSTPLPDPLVFQTSGQALLLQEVLPPCHVPLLTLCLPYPGTPRTSCSTCPTEFTCLRTPHWPPAHAHAPSTKGANLVLSFSNKGPIRGKGGPPGFRTTSQCHTATALSFSTRGHLSTTRKTNNFFGIGKPKRTAFTGFINFFKKNSRPVYYQKIQTNAGMSDVCHLCAEHGHRGGTDPVVDPAWLSGPVSWVGGC